jgi:hypothetical protein
VVRIQGGREEIGWKVGKKIREKVVSVGRSIISHNRRKEVRHKVERLARIV